jgi:zinc protease
MKFITTIGVGLCAAALATTASAADIDIPFHKEVLDNGLVVIVHEDRKAPVVAVNIWYHVGSKNEAPGRTGFAHLFEHLMFQGTEHYDGEYLTALESLGSTDFNATTWFDRTNYFQTVPRNALDAVLWLESERMGHFQAAITQAKLDEQRGVVKNEKRQGDNQPYGRVWEHIQPALFPPGHPYSWETIGSMADLDAATLDDVRQWFRTWYGPNNAVLAIAGDVDTATVIARVKHYFGDIAPVPPLTRPGLWIPRHTENRRMTLQDRVPQARIYRSWTAPNWGSEAARHLGLAAAVLAGDKNSRLYERLVYRERLATDVSLATLPLEIAGVSYLVVSAQPGADLARIEHIVDEELAAFFRKGPSRRELERVTTDLRAGFLRGIEKVGGYGGKAGTLAESMVLGGRPDAWKADLAALDTATPEDLRSAAAQWLGDGSFTLTVLPYPALGAATGGADRSRLPEPGDPPAASFPAIERATLANGLEVVLAPRPGSGLVELQLLLPGGFAADPGARPGTANLAMGMLDEGTANRSALQISEELTLLGASLGTGASLDHAYVGLSALRDKLAPSLSLMADIVLAPAFPPAEIERLRAIYLANLRQEQSRPNSMALRVLPALLFGTAHPYGRPLTGSGTEASLRALTREDLTSFHAAWFRPNHATVVAAGDTTMAQLRPELERLFGAWPAGDVPAAPLPAPARADTDVLYVLDRPGADQSVIFAGKTLPPTGGSEDLALQMLHSVLGGKVSARINMNLREDKHWSYGAYTSLVDARGPRPFFAYAPVQTDKTAEALLELRRELQEITTSRPVTAPELERVRSTDLLGLAGRWETNAAVAGALARSARFGLGDDYWLRYPAALGAVTLDQVNDAARRHLAGQQPIWVVVGDRARIEPALARLGFREVRALAADDR